MNKKNAFLALALIVAGAYHEDVATAENELYAAAQVALQDMQADRA